MRFAWKPTGGFILSVYLIAGAWSSPLFPQEEQGKDKDNKDVYDDEDSSFKTSTKDPVAFVVEELGLDSDEEEDAVIKVLLQRLGSKNFSMTVVSEPHPEQMKPVYGRSPEDEQAIQLNEFINPTPAAASIVINSPKFTQTIPSTPSPPPPKVNEESGNQSEKMKTFLIEVPNQGGGIVINIPSTYIQQPPREASPSSTPVTSAATFFDPLGLGFVGPVIADVITGEIKNGNIPRFVLRGVLDLATVENASRFVNSVECVVFDFCPPRLLSG